MTQPPESQPIRRFISAEEHERELRALGLVSRESPPRMPGSPMTDDTEEDHPAWRKLKAMHDRGEFETIERMVRFWESLEAFGRLGDLMRRAIMWLGIIIASYFAFTEYIVKFIRKSAGAE